MAGPNGGQGAGKGNAGRAPRLGGRPTRQPEFREGLQTPVRPPSGAAPRPSLPRGGAPTRGPVLTDERRVLLNQAVARALLALLLLATVVGVLWLSMNKSPGALGDDAADYAQIARHIARGDGYTSSCVRPIAIGLGLPVGAGPEVTRAPVFPFVAALMLRLSPGNDTIVRATSCLGFLLCLGLLYLTALRAHDRRVANLSVLLLLLNTGALGTAVGGTGSAWAAAMVAGAMYWATFLLRRPEPDERPDPPRRRLPTLPRWAAPLLLGLSIGLAYLAEYALFLGLLAVLVWLALQQPRGSRARVVLPAAIGVLVVALPWWIRNFAVTHNPLFTLDRYGAMLLSGPYPGSSAYRSVANPGNPLLFLLHHPRTLAANAIRWGAGVQGDLATGLGVLPLVGALLLCVTPLRSVDDRPWRWLLAAIAAGIVLATGVTMPFAIANYLPLLPLVALLGAIFLTRLFGRLEVAPRRIAVTLLWAAMLIPVVLAPSPTGASGLTMTATNLLGVARGLPPETVVLTDSPWQAAWYLDRTAVWLPTGQADLTAVQQRCTEGPIVFFLTRALQRWSRQDSAVPYQALLITPRPPEGLLDVPLHYPGDRFLVPAPPSASADGAKPGGGPK